MDALELLRLSVEVTGVLLLVAGGGSWLARRLTIIVKGVEDVRLRLDQLNSSVSRHDREIAWIKGRLGEPLDEGKDQMSSLQR